MRSSRTILVVDHDDATRNDLAGLVARLGFEVVVVADPARALEACDGAAPALALLEVESGGFELCHELHEAFGRRLPIFLMSATRVDVHDRVVALLLGADDYVSKPFHAEELLARMRRSLRRCGSDDRHDQGGREVLTAREQQVLSLLADGLTQRQIASTLVLSPKTVGAHIQHILTKLGYHSRVQAVAYELQLRSR